MKLNKAPGPTGIRVEDLSGWQDDAEKEDATEDAKKLWQKVIELVQHAFTQQHDQAELLSNGILVLIPKDKPGEYCGIALEVIYKLILSIIKTWIKATVEYHDAIHGFWKKRGTGTAIMEMNLKLQL